MILLEYVASFFVEVIFNGIILKIWKSFGKGFNYLDKPMFKTKK